MKKINGFLISLIAIASFAGIFNTTASAAVTNQDQCDQEFSYNKPEGQEVDDQRVKIKFYNFGSTHNSIVDVIAQPGYQTVEVKLTIGPSSNPTVYTYNTDLVGFNPPGDHDIEYTQVKIKKVCVTPTPTETPTPTITPTAIPTPTNAPNNGGGPGDGLSDGRSDGRSSCPECTKAPQAQVLGASTQAVLGASTMAGTGTFEQNLMNIYAIFGMLLIAAGFKSYAKEKTKI